MQQARKSQIGVVHPRVREAPRRAGVARRRSSARPLEALASLALRLPAAALSRAAALSVSLLFGSRRGLRGYGRSGYPEIDHWMAGRRRDFDK